MKVFSRICPILLEEKELPATSDLDNVPLWMHDDPVL